MSAGPPAPPLPPLSPGAPATADDLSPLSTSTQWALLLGPLVGFALILLVVGVIVHPGAAGFLLSLAAGTFVGGGKLVILAGAVDQAPVGQWEIAALVVYIDMGTALAVVGGIQHLYRFPGLGRRMLTARDSSARLLQRNPWMRRIAFLTLAGFVAVPFNGTGALVGALLGRTMGLSRVALLAATALGSVTTSVGLALAGGLWAERINALAERPHLGLLSVAFVLGLTVLVSRWALGGGAQHPLGGNASAR
jgi:uncharacterized membrane protein